MTARPASRSTLLALSLGHLCADLCASALFALVPFLVVERHYTYAQVGVFALAASISSAVLQPLAGVHGDRAEGRWLLPVGLVVTALGIAAVGFTTAYPLTLAAAVLCMAGVATYHPEGARWARRAAGSRVTANMGIFSLGGVVGYALGPLVVAAVLWRLGLEGTGVLALVPLVAALVVALVVARFHAHRVRQGRPLASLEGRSEWRPFAALVALFCLGSGVSSGLFVFVPLFLVDALGSSPGAGNVMSSVLLGAGAAGTLLGGLAAQRFGRRIVLLLPQLLLVPLIALIPGISYAAMVPVMALIGIALNTNMSLALVLAQEYLPRHMGLATGLTIGLSGGVGGLIVAGLGLLADAAGLTPVLYVIAALPLAVAALSALLPRPAAAPAGTLWSLRTSGAA